MMTGLIILLILIPIALFIILFTLLSRSSEQQKLTESLYDRIKHLSQEIGNLSKEIKDLKLPAETKKVVIEEKPVQKTTEAPIATPQKEEIKPIVVPERKVSEFAKPVTQIKEAEPVSMAKGSTEALNLFLKKKQILKNLLAKTLPPRLELRYWYWGFLFWLNMQ